MNFIVGGSAVHDSRQCISYTVVWICLLQGSCNHLRIFRLAAPMLRALNSEGPGIEWVYVEPLET